MHDTVTWYLTKQCLGIKGPFSPKLKSNVKHFSFTVVIINYLLLLVGCFHIQFTTRHSFLIFPNTIVFLTLTFVFLISKANQTIYQAIFTIHL